MVRTIVRNVIPLRRTKMENEVQPNQTPIKLAAELVGVINYFRQEFDLTYYEVYGILEAIKFDLLIEARDSS